MLAVVLVGEEESVWEWSVTMRAGGEEHACRHIGFPVWRAGSVCHRVSQSGPPDVCCARVDEWLANFLSHAHMPKWSGVGTTSSRRNCTLRGCASFDLI